MGEEEMRLIYDLIRLETERLAAELRITFYPTPLVITHGTEYNTDEQSFSLKLDMVVPVEE